MAMLGRSRASLGSLGTERAREQLGRVSESRGEKRQKARRVWAGEAPPWDMWLAKVCAKSLGSREGRPTAGTNALARPGLIPFSAIASGNPVKAREP